MENLRVCKVYEIFDHMYNSKNEAEKIEENWFPKEQVKTCFIILDEQELKFFIQENHGVMASAYSYDTEQEAYEAIENEEY